MSLAFLCGLAVGAVLSNAVWLGVRTTIRKPLLPHPDTEEERMWPRWAGGPESQVRRCVRLAKWRCFG